MLDTIARCDACNTEIVVTTFNALAAGPPSRQSHAIGLAADMEGWRRTDDLTVWRICRIGLRFAICGSILYLVLWLILAAFVLYVAPSMPLRPGVPPPKQLQITVWAMLILMGVGVLTHLVGQIVCCFTPAPFHKSAVRSVIFVGLTIVGTIVSACAFTALAMSQNRSLDAFFWAYRIAVIVVITLSVAAFYFWSMYLRDVAKKFGATSLAGQFVAYLLVNLFGNAGYLYLSWYEWLAGQQPGRTSAFDVAFVVALIGVSVWYSILLGLLISKVGARIDSRY